MPRIYKLSLMLFFCFTSCCHVSAQSTSPLSESHITAFKELVRTLRAGESLTKAQVETALPASTIISRPHWEESDQAVGNVENLSGALQGIIVFQSHKQHTLMAQGVSLSSDQQVPNDSDDIQSIQVYVGDMATSFKNNVKQKLQTAMSKVFKMQPTSSDVVNLPNFQSANGWVISWKLKSGSTVDLWQNWYGHKYVLCVYPNAATD